MKGKGMKGMGGKLSTSKVSAKGSKLPKLGMAGPTGKGACNK